MVLTFYLKILKKGIQKKKKERKNKQKKNMRSLRDPLLVVSWKREKVIYRFFTAISAISAMIRI